MPRDENLALERKATPVTATGQGTAVDTEGGFFCVVRIQGGTITDADETFDLIVQASIDGGTNYRNIGAFPQIVAADDDVEVARPVYVPKPDSSNTVTKVRTDWTVAGTTPSNAMDVWLEPMLSLGIPGVDEQLTIGVEKLLSA